MIMFVQHTCRQLLPSIQLSPRRRHHLFYGTEFFKLVASGVVKVNVYKEYPFTTEGAREAQTDLAARGGKTFGKLVIKIADE